MSELLSALLPIVPQIAIIYIQATLLPMRKRWLFVALEAVLSCAALLIGLSAGGTPSLVAHTVISATGMLVLPPLFYRRTIPLAWRLVATAVAVLLMFYILGLVPILLGEVACGALWVTSGNEYFLEAIQSAPLMQSIIIHLFFVAVVLMGGRLFKTLFEKQQVERLTTTRGQMLLGGLPISQALLVWTLLLIMMQVGDVDSRGLVLTCALALVTLCIATDVLIIRSVNGYWRTLDEDKYAKKLKQRLQEQLDSFEHLNAKIASTARLCHDMRNHLLVLGALIDRGELAQADAYADDVLAELEKTSFDEAA